MIKNNKISLLKFEEKIASLFREKKILAPIHLDNGNEWQLIKIFEQIHENDWVCGTWRQHYHCLLRGVPKEKLIDKILEGKSIGLQFPEYKVVSSAIVAGIIPIALGISQSIQLKKESGKVYCFIGDQTSETGTFNEAYRYSMAWDLPIVWVIANNEKSVCTPLNAVWNHTIPSIVRDIVNDSTEFLMLNDRKLIYYKYESQYPHAGPGGERIQF